ncbi:DUF4147 domain-containing protein [Desulfobacula sp.]|uniref:DUF4147 domain-containing protein n=1 Tax=Desulfobacula sp. TaxID=2593537 RepID=UPI003FA42998
MAGLRFHLYHVGDDLDIIASGLTVPDTGTFEDCKNIIDSYNIALSLPKNVLNHINKGCKGEIPETPKPDDPYFKKVKNLIIGNNFNTLIAARAKAESLGYNTIILSSLDDLIITGPPNTNVMDLRIFLMK